MLVKVGVVVLLGVKEFVDVGVYVYVRQCLLVAYMDVYLCIVVDSLLFKLSPCGF